MSVSKSMKDNHADGRNAVIVGGEEVLNYAVTRHSKRDTSPSPSIHEGMVERHNVRDPATGDAVADPVLSRMADALRNARLGAERAERIAAAILANQMVTLPARHKQVRDQAWKSVEPALRDLDHARQNAQQAIATLTERTAQPPKPKDQISYMTANDVRSALRSMSPDDREKALGTAIAEDDDVLLGAVIGAPNMLSGISKLRQQALVGAWRNRRHGPDIDRLGRLQKAVEDLDRAGALTVKYTTGLCDHELIARAEASEAAVRAALNS